MTIDFEIVLGHTLSKKIVYFSVNFLFVALKKLY